MNQANPLPTNIKPVEASPDRQRAAQSKPVLARGDDDGFVENALLMGIDLGTSRSSVASMNGVRKTVESYVGYPKDAVSRKFLRQDTLYGRTALENQLALDLYRPLEKGVIKGTFEGEGGTRDEEKRNLRAARDLLRHLVHLVHPERDQVLYGVVGVPAQATVKNKQAMLDIAKEVLDSVMIVSEPFSVAYGMERMSDVLVVDIGAGTTDLVRMHGTVPGDDDQISFTIAGDAIDEKLYELIKKKHPQAQLTVNMCKQFKEQYGYVSDTKDKIEVTIPVDGKPTPHDITAEMKQACEIMVQPVLDGIHKLIATFNPEFQDRLRNNIILAGGGSLIDGLNKRIEDGLSRVGGGRVTVVEEPLYAGANGALQLALDMPAEYWQQLK
jgi:rod shape-determining protein MreB and related proteins